MLSGTASALAAEDISVSVDRRTITFADQIPVIVNDRVLVPVRGVFEALGARVLWNEAERKVTVFSKDNLSRIILHIDSVEFEQIIFHSLLNYDINKFTSEVAPQIINGRTMVPLYLVADYMSNKAEWNGEERSVTVTSKERLKMIEGTTPAEGMTAEETLNATLPEISLTADKADVKAGDEVTVRVNISNTAALPNTQYFGTTATIGYDRDNFTFKSLKYIIDDKDSAKAHNPDYMGSSVKLLYLHNPNMLTDIKDGCVAELVFTANNDLGGSFTLSDRLTNLGCDTTLTVVTEEGDAILDTADKLYINTAPVVVK